MKSPYGFSLMLLRGCTADLNEAILKNDLNRVDLYQQKLFKQIESFTGLPKDNLNFAAKEYQKLEESSLIDAKNALKLASVYKKSKIRLV